MLRKLLHERTWAKAFELTGMPVMRRHKNLIRLRIENDGTIGTETEASDSDSEREETDTTESYTSSSCTDAEPVSGSKVMRQNAVDGPRELSSSCSSWGSNFGYVRYYDNNTDLHLNDAQLPIKGDCTREIFQNAPYNVHNNVKTIDTNIQLQLPSLGGIDNPFFLHSESTENSSFEARPYMACEDLVNMDQNTQMGTLGSDDADFIPTRRSFPNTNAKNDPLPKLWKSTEENYSRESGERVSETPLTIDVLSALDPPSPKQSLRSPIHSIIIDPPPMFRNTEDDMKIINMNLNTDVPFRKHSLNSDKRLSRRSIARSMMESDSFTRGDDSRLQRMSSQSENQAGHKKCECCNRSLCPSPRSSDSGVVGSCNLASPELNMHEYSSSANTGNDSDSQEKRASDHSQEKFTNDLRKQLTLSEIEAARFEDQCRCTSPFGSTARTSCVTSVTSETSLDVMDMSSANVTSTFTTAPPVTSPQIKRTSLRRNIERYVPEIKLKPEPPPRVYRKPSTHLEIPKNVRHQHPCQWSTLNITERTKPSLHYHMRIYRETPTRAGGERKSRHNAPRNRDMQQSVDPDYTEVRKTRSRSADLSKMQKGLAEAQSGFVVYRSDLYAHWWMKAKLPITVVTDSGKDYSFVKRYCFVYHWFEDNNCLEVL